MKSTRPTHETFLPILLPASIQPKSSEQTFFDQPDRERHQELDRMADQITEKFGKLGIRVVSA